MEEFDENTTRFERLLLELSSAFVSVAAKDIDAQIRSALGVISESLGLDRGMVTVMDPDTRERRLTHVWARSGAVPSPQTLHLDETFPWMAANLLAGKVVYFSHPDELPAAAAVDRASAQRLGGKSHISVPFLVGGKVIGTLSFTAVTRHRAWPPDLVGRLRLLAQIFIHAVLRQRAKQEIARQLQFERLLTELSSTFVNLPASEVDQRIDDALERIVMALDLDRANLAKIDERNNFLITHAFNLEGIPPLDKGIDSADMPWVAEKMRNREVICLADISDLPEAAIREREMFAELCTLSSVTIPLVVGNSVIGAVIFSSVRARRIWTDDIIERMQLIAQVFANALARTQADRELQLAFSKIQELKEHLEAENLYLRQEVDLEHDYEEIVGNSDAIKRVLNQVEQVAPTNSTVLLLGETGTGKELLARATHNRSTRHDRVMVKVNCAALPATLVESELFGREKGAYTGALTKQVGRFEIADHSTIFLDEIGELPLELQAKLLRVLQDGELERLGSARTIKVDVRVVAATNRDLAKAVREGSFRHDLFYRLNVFPISVPPLRERREDIPLLVWTFVRELSVSMGKNIQTIPRVAMERLQSYPWPGNVRELRNVIERAMILSHGPTLRIELNESELDACPESLGEPTCEPASAAGVSRDGEVKLEDVQRSHILTVLARTKWRVRGKNGAADILGVKPTTLESRIQRLGLQRPARDL